MVMPAGIERKLTTILAADAEGYSRVMDTDEVGGLGALRQARDVFARLIAGHGGRIANTAGDGLIAEFPSVVEAVQCAIEVQRELAERGHDGVTALQFRIGIHLGDVIVEGEDLLGEGVNLAARLQTMAEPGGILVSRQVYDQIQNKIPVGFDYLGEQRLKNFTREVGIYRANLGGHGFADWLSRMRRPRPHGAPDDHAETATHPPAPHDERRAPPHRDPEPAVEPVPAGLRTRVRHHAIVLGAIWAIIFVVDIATGDGFWAHWPGLALATLLALEAAPLYAPAGFSLHFARGAVIVGMLVVINLITWAGYPWALWPAGALIAVELLRRLRFRPR